MAVFSILVNIRHNLIFLIYRYKCMALETTFHVYLLSTRKKWNVYVHVPGYDYAKYPPPLLDLSITTPVVEIVKAKII